MRIEQELEEEELREFESLERRVREEGHSDGGEEWEQDEGHLEEEQYDEDSAWAEGEDEMAVSPRPLSHPALYTLTSQLCSLHPGLQYHTVHRL